jgi:transcriptional regulator with XRE-family HTH domain
VTAATPPRTRNRPSLAAQDRDLARQVGGRIRAARTRAGMTQKALAEPRYTKAYISGLENGLIKPSIAALRYLARRLDTTPEALLADPDAQWLAIDAELRLAAGDWQAAADRFRAIVDGDATGTAHGLALLGLAEASYRLGHARETIAYAAEARELLSTSAHASEARRATYWLAAGHHACDDPVRARMLFEELLATADHDTTDPDLRVRILVSLAAVLSYAGEPLPAIALLEEARRIGADLDDRRRATMLHSLAQSYRLSGDLEGAVRTAIESLGLFRAVEARGEVALTENELALTYLGLGNLGEAQEHATAARTLLESDRNEFLLATVGDTEARIALASGALDDAARSAAQAAILAERTDNTKGLVDALLTGARTARRQGDSAAALAALERAAAAAESGPPGRLRQVLTEWSEIAAESGDHASAYELSRRALALG